MDASIFDSVLSHTRHSDASEKREENSLSTFGRFRLWTSFESSPVSVKNDFLNFLPFRGKFGTVTDDFRCWIIESYQIFVQYLCPTFYRISHEVIKTQLDRRRRGLGLPVN